MVEKKKGRVLVIQAVVILMTAYADWWWR